MSHLSGIKSHCKLNAYTSELCSEFVADHNKAFMQSFLLLSFVMKKKKKKDLNS